MAVPNMVKRNSYGNKKEILIAPELAFTIGCVLAGNQGIVKAGTPVGSSTSVLTNRQTLLSSTASAEQVQGIVLHDVDTTAGDTNATLVLKGQVDLLKLEADVKSKITSNVIAKLDDIIFMNGNK